MEICGIIDVLRAVWIVKYESKDEENEGHFLSENECMLILMYYFLTIQVFHHLMVLKGWNQSGERKQWNTFLAPGNWVISVLGHPFRILRSTDVLFSIAGQ